MLDLDRFYADCRDAVAQDDSHKGVSEILSRVMRTPDAVIAALGEPQRAGVTSLYSSPGLLIDNVIWGPYMTIMPHDHRMWALIGVYSGREDNIFWRRLPPDGSHGIEAAGAESLCRGDCMPLGPDIIHSVTNPIPRFTGAIHIYGGDLLNQERSEWNPETLREHPFDVEKANRLFEESNRVYWPSY
ncbi:hypothetical protein ACFPL7_02090 [Dongia soli]|uniref:Metal-dependent enzyme (Double-stranded beta helix superfamily) n=1 Tax=Dongia soli TaxID=600628 RepID=A0ABU5EFU7_9PROT|nr:hypothetical protein [Dongia soli]MDY0885283.1 hypothetical protein [Dongia soli]